jgi:hypothetical protein
LALGKLNFSFAVIGLTSMPTKPELVNFPRPSAILARAQALLWVRDCISPGRPQTPAGNTAKALLARQMH